MEITEHSRLITYQAGVYIYYGFKISGLVIYNILVLPPPGMKISLITV
jgi:hypothetical protein